MSRRMNALIRSRSSGISKLSMAPKPPLRMRLDFSPQALASGVCYAGVVIFFVAAARLTTAAKAVLLQYPSPVFLLVLEPW